MMRALAILVVGVLLAPGVKAHQAGTTGFAALTVQDQTVRYSLTLSQIPPSPLAEQMGVGQPDRKPDYGLLATAIGEHVHLANNGQACVAGPTQVAPPTATVMSVTAIVDFVCAGTMGRLSIRDDMFDVLGTSVHTLARIQWPDGLEQFAFSPDERETSVQIASAGTATAGVGSFFVLGLEHIAGGWDHLLFLFMLILCGGNLVSLLKIITGFTVAHSITLALAVLDVVVLPGRLVESVIALSIAYVAAENLFPRYAMSRRWAVSFLFGLAHGFGFSAVLRDMGLPHENLAWALLNFNLGVEAGQAAVVLMVLPLLVWMRRTRWEPAFVTAASAGVLVVAVGVFAQRAFVA